MKISVYNQAGEKVSDSLLPKEIFDIKLNPDLVYQVVVSQTANRRQVIANTKGRGEVRGGGRKPWRQKGTGRARHGSIRSPIWRHGGITFGPTKERVFEKKIPDKMRKKALFMVLSQKAKNNLLVLLDNLEIDQPKTKLMAEIIKGLKAKIEGLKESSFLIVLPKYDKNLLLALRNIANSKVAQAKEINVLDLLSFKYLIMPKESIKIIKETFFK